MRHHVRRLGPRTPATGMRTLTQTLARLFTLGLVVAIARVEGMEMLGRYLVTMSMVGLVAALSDAGLTPYLTLEIARQPTRDQERHALGRLLPLKALLAAAGTGGLWLLALVLPPWSDPLTRPLLALGSLLLVPEALGSALRALVCGQLRTSVCGAIDTLVRATGLVLSLLALWRGPGVLGVVGSMVVASALGVILYAAALYRLGDTPIRHPEDHHTWRAALSAARPHALNTFSAALFGRADLIWLALWHGPLAAGWYGAVYRLWETFALAPASGMDALAGEGALRAILLDRGDLALRHNLRRAAWLVAGGTTLLALAGSYMAPVVLTTFYGPEPHTRSTALALQLLLGATPALCLSLLSANTLGALHRHDTVTRPLIVAAWSNLALNLALAPRWGTVAAAVVAAGGEWLLAAMLWGKARREIESAEPVQT